jgi:hypothetical protein
MHRIALLLALFSLAACNADKSAPQAPGPDRSVAPAPTAAASPLQTQLRQYETDARACVSAVRDAALPQAQACAQQLLAAAMTPAYTARKPECKAYLEATLKIREAWPALSPETIERDYHHDAALPASETTTVCYHMKDLIVHPATALRLLSLPEPGRQQAARELEEVVAHAGVVASGL